MLTLNQNYEKLQASYLFADIAKRVTTFQQENPDRSIIKLGIGDVTLPLPEACREAFHSAVDELGQVETFRGYGPEQGYEFLREAIAKKDFHSRGADISADEVFVSDGAKCDTGNFQELFGQDIKIAIPDPVYPVYVDTNVMAGRTGTFENERYQGLQYLEANPENNYTLDLPQEPVDLIYLCYPNNPTGVTASKEQLKAWVDYARENQALILFDAAYVEFIRDDEIPHTIYEIDGAKEVAVEFRSFSKTAGFTGVRCAYTVVPRALRFAGISLSLHQMWFRRQSTKFNGVSYPVQRAAEAVYSEAGQKQTKALTDYYLENAGLIREGMKNAGFSVVGGEHSPYIWINSGQDSWKTFDLLLSSAGVVCTPGTGFGKCGRGHIRLSAFNNRENVVEAIERVKQAL